VSPATGVVFRCLYGLPLLLIAAWFERRAMGAMTRRAVALSAIAGLFFAADLLSFHYVVDLAGAGIATIMGNLSVIVVAIAAWLVWGEKPRREVLIALPIMLVGIVLITGVVGGEAYGENAPLGVAIGCITAFAYAGYLLVIRRASPDARPAGPVTVATITCGLAAALFGLVVGDLELAPTMPAHAYLLAYGISSQSIGYLFIQVSLPRLPAVLTSAILLAQPVMTVLLAIILLGESPSPAQVAGILMVVVGLGVASGIAGRVRDGVRPVAPAA
jgi:drug/metabolite transporter (DMT)-like permease